MSEVRTTPKRLADLHPKWGGYFVNTSRLGVALTFDCPCGREVCPMGGRMWIPIQNPIDGGPPPEPPGGATWLRVGDNFEALSLTPSIHAVGHWHGFVTNGMVLSC